MKDQTYEVPGDPSVVPYEWGRETKRLSNLLDDEAVKRIYRKAVDEMNVAQVLLDAQVDAEAER